MQTGPQALTLHNEAIKQQYLGCIINNRTDELRALSQQYDPNLVFGTKESIINFANYFGRADCAKILANNGADENFANEITLVKQFGHIFNLQGKIKTELQLKNGQRTAAEINEELASPQAGISWARERFDTLSEDNPEYQLIADAFEFTANTDNYTLSNINNPDNFLKRIKENPDQITAIPSGYTGHNIGIMFYKGNMIVSDGTGDIQVYKVDPQKITSDDIKKLMTIPDKETYQKTINKIAGNTSPTILKYKQQTVNNCCYRNFVSAIEGVFYIDKLEKTADPAKAKQLARDEHKKFNKLDKMDMIYTLADKIENGEVDKEIAVALFKDYFNKVNSKGVISQNARHRLNLLSAAMERAQSSQLTPTPPVATAARPIDTKQNVEADLFSNNIPPITPLQTATTATHRSTTPVVSDAKTTVKQLCDFMDKHKENYRYAEKQSPWDPAQKSIEVSFLDNGKTKGVGYIHETPEKGVTYSVSKNVSGNDLATSIDSICELAVKNYKEGTVFDLSNTSADKLPLVQASLEKHIKILKDSGVEDAKLPKVVLNNQNSSRRAP